MGMETYKPAFGGGKQRNTTPRIWLTGSLLRFNGPAHTQWLTGHKVVELGFDKAFGRIGLRPAGTTATENTLRLQTSKKSGGAHISVGGFIGTYHLQPLTGRELDATLDGNLPGWLILIPGRPLKRKNNPTASPPAKKPPQEQPDEGQPKTLTGYQCVGCGASDDAWGTTHPHQCPKCGGFAFEPLYQPPPRRGRRKNLTLRNP